MSLKASSKQNNPPLTTTRGFTFIEVVIAVALLATLSLGISLLINQSMIQSNAVTERTKRLEDLDRALHFIQEDLSQAVSRFYRSEPNQFSYPFTANIDGDLIQFIRLGQTHTFYKNKLSNLERIRYQQQGKQLNRISSPIIDGTSATQWSTATLLDDITNLEIRYYNNQTWNISWTIPDASNSNLLPRAITLMFEYPPFGKITRVFLLPGYLDD